MCESMSVSYKVIGIGEALWDLLPSGPQLGGAPANFACHASSLGAEARVITRVGNDAMGHEIYKRFAEMGLADGTGQIDDEAPTGTVTVTLNEAGVPEFVIRENVAWDRLAVTTVALQMAQRADAISFGSLAQRDPVSRSSIQRLLAASRRETLRVFDVNLRQNYFTAQILEESLWLSNILKLNENELPVIAGMFGFGGDLKQQIEQIAGRFRLKLVAFTRGARGSLLYEEGRWSEQFSRPAKVVDTVGAGDSFTAALVMGLLNRMDLDEIHATAADIARFVCTRPGATPSLPRELKRRFFRLTRSL